MLEEIVKNAKKASNLMAVLSDEVKNDALLRVAEAIKVNTDKIVEANNKDLDFAKDLLNSGKISQSTYSRLKLDENKLRDMIQGIVDVSKLENPVNKILFEKELDENLILKKVTCPIGLIAVVFEARPDVISQISALIIKSGNAVILKGGKEAVNTNKAIFEIITNVLSNIDSFPQNAISQIFSRDDVSELLKLDNYIDLVIPRGGNALVKYIKENTKIPVLGHADGICHIFIDESAEKDMAEKIIVDAKTQYPSACNSVETVLVHKNYPYLKGLIDILKQNNVKIIGDEDCLCIDSTIEKANDEDWTKEYGDKIVSVKIINNIDEAIIHINKFGSHHTDSIITDSKENAEKFCNYVDSAGVYVNASTRFADGFRYGFGAEVGISTNKTHARGPVGIDGLTIYKYKLLGNGHIVKDYVDGRKTFTHKNLI